MLGNYEEEFRSEQKQLRRNLDALAESRKKGEAPGSSAAQQKVLVSELGRDFGAAEESLKSMEMEAKMMQPASERKPRQQAVARLREELRTVFREYDALLSKLQRERLLELDQETMQLTEKTRRQQRQRVLGATERLHESSRRLSSTNQMMLETEEIGQDILQGLHAQRETIQRSKDKTQQINSNLDQSKKSIENLEQGNCAMM